MSVLSAKHEGLIDGAGLCSVPMWCGGMPAGFCDEPAYGFRPKGAVWRNAHAGRMMRHDGRYDGYVPGLACPRHGGPKLKEVAHLGDPCQFCKTSHDDVATGPCPARYAESVAMRG